TLKAFPVAIRFPPAALVSQGMGDAKVPARVGWITSIGANGVEWGEPATREEGEESVPQESEILVGGYIDPTLPFPSYRAYRESRVGGSDDGGDAGEAGGNEGEDREVEVVGIGMLRAIFPSLALHERRRVAIQCIFTAVVVGGLLERIRKALNERIKGKGTARTSVESEWRSTTPSNAENQILGTVPSTPLKSSSVPSQRIPSSVESVRSPGFRLPQRSPSPYSASAQRMRRDGANSRVDGNSGLRSGGSGSGHGRRNGGGEDEDRDEFVDAPEAMSPTTIAPPTGSGGSPGVPADGLNTRTLCDYKPGVMEKHVHPMVVRFANGEEIADLGHTTPPPPITFTFNSIADPSVYLNALIGANMFHFQPLDGPADPLARDLTVGVSLVTALRGIMDQLQWRECLDILNKLREGGRQSRENATAGSALLESSEIEESLSTLEAAIVNLEKVKGRTVVCVVDLVRDATETSYFATDFDLDDEGRVRGLRAEGKMVRCMLSQIYLVDVEEDEVLDMLP
ncbi:hypothetical protein HDU93_009502, partial [Gonapodya sp. JEL0774]